MTPGAASMGGSATDLGEEIGTELSTSVRQIDEFREAARWILRSDLTDNARAAALDRLYRRAKEAPLAKFAVSAIVAEVCWSIDRDDVWEMRAFGDPLERAHRSLRARGYSSCPECRSPLSNEVDWMLWRQARRCAVAEFTAREGSVR